MEQKLNIGEMKLKRWMLTMKKLLTIFNYSIVEGLMMWKTNIDREFEGIEVGFIDCRSALFVSTSWSRKPSLCRSSPARSAPRSSIRPVCRSGSRLPGRTSVRCAKDSSYSLINFLVIVTKLRCPTTTSSSS